MGAKLWSIVFMLAAVAIQSTAVFCRAADEETKTFTEGKIVKLGSFSYRVNLSAWSSYLTNNAFTDRRPDAKYLFIRITVANRGKEPKVIPSFRLVDEKDREYQISERSWAVRDSFGPFKSLNPAMIKAGFVVFDVPPSRTYRLKLLGGQESSENAFVKLSPYDSLETAAAAIEAQLDAIAEHEKQKEKEAQKAKADAEEKRKAEEAAAAEAARWRTWTDESGKFKVEARFGGMMGGKVKLIKRDKSSIVLEAEKLSPQDREWLKAKAGK